MTETILATYGITKSFGALKASNDISIDLRPGEIHAIIGPNGAGKSTLIGQICGSLAPDAGRVELMGQDVTTLSTGPRPLEDTVLENATLGAMGASGRPWRFWSAALGDRSLRARAEAALERVGLADHKTKRCADLSHGQRRQLEVAVALTLEPKAFVMDEPMAGLGAEGSKNLTGFLDSLRQEAPILLVEHDMDAVFALADRISVLVYGEVIATGSVDQIRSDPRVREAYLGESA